MLFWLTLGQRKSSLVVFLWKRRTSSVVFLATILFLMSWYRLLETIFAKKTTKLVLLFHKNITKLVFLWPNVSQKYFNVLKRKRKIFIIIEKYFFELFTWCNLFYRWKMSKLTLILSIVVVIFISTAVSTW